MLLVLLLIIPVLGSLIAGLMKPNARNAESWLAAIVCLLCVIITAIQFPLIQAGQTVQQIIPWAPALGLSFNLRMDAFAWLFTLVVSSMGGLVVLYARYYMSPKDPVPRFFSFLLLFMAAMLGVILSGNLIQLVLFWEMTSLVSFMLISYWYHRADARRGASMALTVTAAGGLCLFAGVLLLGHIVGSYDLDVLMQSGDTVRAHPWYNAVVILIALGALTKSAQFPFQFWLPNAMAAPTPVSAFLHSATMVKAGVFLLARLWPVLSGTDIWFWIIGGAGLITLLLGAYASIFQTDLKGVLAYSTISHLGLITLLLGMNRPLALVAALFHMINHATFKAALFMAAGVVDHETGTRDINRLSGLYKYMPITTALAMVSAAAMAGVPLLNGFISKEMFFAETTYAGMAGYLKIFLPLAAVIAGTFSVAYSLRFILGVFFGPDTTKNLPHQPHDPNFLMLLPSLLLVIICLVVGVMPGVTLGPLLTMAARSILHEQTPVFSLSIWHGVNLPLVMSFIALIMGSTLYFALRRLQDRKPGVVPFINWMSGYQSFQILMGIIQKTARGLQIPFSTIRMQPQIFLIVFLTLLVALLPLWHTSIYAHWNGAINFKNTDFYFAVMWLIGAVSAVLAAYHAKFSRFTSLTFAGVAGLMTCLTFVWLAAPDLALTQLVVEIATVVLLLLGLRWLPQPHKEKFFQKQKAKRLFSHIRHTRDMIIAILVGLGMSSLSLIIMTREPSSVISSFFIDKALTEGGGRNVVNVILVDFRAFDTLGEITVLGIVSLTVYALLRRFRPAKETMTLPIQQLEQDGEHPPLPDVHQSVPNATNLVPVMLARLWLPIGVLVSIYFLLRGHNLPGGGFIGGLTMSVTIIVQYMMNGVMWVEARPRLHPQYWIGWGLLFAGGTAVSAWLAARPFLTAMAIHPNIPYIGELHLSSVLIFDVGVYLLVVGSTVLMLVALAHQSLRVHRKASVVED